MLPVASSVLQRGQRYPIGVVVAEHHGIRAALDGSSHHVLDIQTDPVGGALPQPDGGTHPLAAVQTDQHGALVVRPRKLCHQIAAHLLGGLDAAGGAGALRP